MNRSAVQLAAGIQKEAVKKKLFAKAVPAIKPFLKRSLSLITGSRIPKYKLAARTKSPGNIRALRGERAKVWGTRGLLAGTAIEGGGMLMGGGEEKDIASPEKDRRRPSRRVDDDYTYEQPPEFPGSEYLTDRDTREQIAGAGIGGAAGGLIGYGIGSGLGTNRTLSTLAGMFGGGTIGLVSAQMLQNYFREKAEKYNQPITKRDVVGAKIDKAQADADAKAQADADAKA